MEVFGWYALFAVTTAFVSILELLHPVVSSRKEEVEYKSILYPTFFIICLLAAPLVFLSCIVPSMGERFRVTLEGGLFEG